MDCRVMLAVSRAELLPEKFESLARRRVEKVVRDFGERKQFAPGRLGLADAGRLGGRQIRADALALGEPFGKLGQVFEQTSAALESLGRIPERLCDAGQRVLKRNPAVYRVGDGGRGATER